MLGRNALLAFLIYFLGLTLAIPNLVADEAPPPDPTVPANSAGLATIGAEIHKRDVDPDDERIKCDTTLASPPDNDITDVLSIIRGTFALAHCNGQGLVSGLGCQRVRRSGKAEVGFCNAAPGSDRCLLFLEKITKIQEKCKRDFDGLRAGGRYMVPEGGVWSIYLPG